MSAPAELGPALAEALRYDTKALVEPAIDGREIECSVLGNEEPQAFPPGEVVPRHEFYSYEAKYLDPQGAELRLPAELPEATRAEVMRLAVAAFRAVEASGMARVDFFVEKTGGRIWINEINTLPGFTNISMYPKMCEVGRPGLPAPAGPPARAGPGAAPPPRRAAVLPRVALFAGQADALGGLLLIPA